MEYAVDKAFVFTSFFKILPLKGIDPATSRSEVRGCRQPISRKAHMEQRHYPRVKTCNLISYVGLTADGEVIDQCLAKALNISQNGIFLETTRIIFSEFISLMSVDASNNLIEIMGEVIYSTRFGAGKFGTGIRFQGLHAENIQFAMKLIKVFNARKYEFARAINQ